MITYLQEVDYLKDANAVPETVEFNGVTYRLMGSGKYYLSQYSTNKERQTKAKGLHVAIWEYYNNKSVPDGYCIHHKDGNTFNNDISNLECIERTEHLRYHATLYNNDPKNKQIVEKSLELAREASKNWHRSKEGRDWHSKHGKEVMKKRLPINLTCKYCGKSFQSIQPWAKYCSSKCADKMRTKTNRVEVHGTCIVCGKEFISTKSKKQKLTTRFCSKSCRNKYAYTKRKSKEMD